MRKKIVKNIIFMSLISFIIGNLYGSLYNLSRSRIVKLNRGDLIVDKAGIEGAPWPEVTIYSVINATPQEAMAVYISFQEHKNFIPGLLKSEPSKYISPTDIHIDFEVSLAWPLANSRFTTGNKLIKLKNGGYSVKWYPVSHSAAKDCHGEIMFLPFYNRTLFIYTNFTFPKNRLASLFTGRMIKNLKRTVKAIVRRINTTSQDKGKMRWYQKQLKRLFSGKYIFKNIITS